MYYNIYEKPNKSNITLYTNNMNIILFVWTLIRNVSQLNFIILNRRYGSIFSTFFFLFLKIKLKKLNKFFTAWGWNSGQSSPTSTKDFKKFVVIRVAGDEKNEAGLSK